MGAAAAGEDHLHLTQPATSPAANPPEEISQCNNPPRGIRKTAGKPFSTSQPHPPFTRTGEAPAFPATSTHRYRRTPADGH